MRHAEADDVDDGEGGDLVRDRDRVRVRVRVRVGVRVGVRARFRVRVRVAAVPWDGKAATVAFAP